MKAYLLLLPISFLPAVAGILVTRPMWRIRQLPNEAIQGIGLVVMISVLIGCCLLYRSFSATQGLSDAPASY